MSDTSAQAFSPYDDTELINKHVAGGNHRDVIGGLWDELGALQADFLKANGLRPQHTLIDIGAGSLRAGVKLVPYLDSGNYYAIDLQAALLEAGYVREIEPAGLAGRFPRGNFAANAVFDVSGFRCMFDFGIAQSVFTHMPIARLGACLSSVAPHFRPGGQLFVTVFLAPPGVADKAFTQWPGGVATSPDRDPFHTTLHDLQGIASQASGWQMSVIGNWAHPRNQQMVRFTRQG
ncbi:class I SAM-dependent methyltransferase [Limobrevibacterium gyesilva]|uniref:Class I SAM-dependent methyltransferase n=1 Tax=Limobrevibacterium gyesilva TaxID=2991712 RepID=A0AA42CG90_9PROT|nr:class I SAM-dependent methyltransferase [Limobrevibacterium gyesilva]MCW3475801.1 class I SAM-dependent methyltransferase [Limobrevibacterium gyesilva]